MKGVLFMKFNGKSIALTSLLIIILFVVIFIEIALFITGPSAKYDAKVEKQIQNIQKNYDKIENIQRHVFHYIIYIGEDEDNIVWFNEEGKPIVTKEKSTLQMDQAKSEAEKLYGWKDVTVSLGYGYDHPVYVVKANNCEVLLDYDTFKVVYYLDKDVKS